MNIKVLIFSLALIGIFSRAEAVGTRHFYNNSKGVWKFQFINQVRGEPKFEFSGRDCLPGSTDTKCILAAGKSVALDYNPDYTGTDLGTIVISDDHGHMVYAKYHDNISLDFHILPYAWDNGYITFGPIAGDITITGDRFAEL